MRDPRAAAAAAAGVSAPFGSTVGTRGTVFRVVATRGPVRVEIESPDGVRDELALGRVDPALWSLEVPGVGPGWRYRYLLGGRRALDPWAHALVGGEEWASEPRDWWSLVVDRQPLAPGPRPAIDPSERVIYEAHLRGFTRHPSSGVEHPGTYRGFAERLDEIVDLGVTTIELMPLCEFDETEVTAHNPSTGARLLNFWGYQPINFFAPKAAYAADPRPGAAIGELRELVEAIHRRGLEVVVDMVYNHTGERPDNPGVAGLSVLAPETAFLLAPGERGRDFTGCGNTLHCQHPLIRRLIRESMGWWVGGLGVDGFRLDLAAVLARGQAGELLAEPPLLAEIAADPGLAGRLYLAEPWDLGGAPIGSFARSVGWKEWNGPFRDDVRCFVRGDQDLTAGLARRIAGSRDLFEGSPQQSLHSVNFVTCHDGFTLADLVAYRDKHNFDNAEHNRDGSDWNHSWNHGVEGPSEDPAIEAARRRDVRTLLLLLLLARGTPMLLAGDEIGRSQGGNNNAWCRDDEVGWLSRDGADLALRRYVQALLAWRRSRPQLRRGGFAGTEIDWHGERLDGPDWERGEPVLAFSIAADGPSPALHVALNASDSRRCFELPSLAPAERWRRVIDTARQPRGSDDPLCWQPVHAASVAVAARCAVVLEAWPVGARRRGAGC